MLCRTLLSAALFLAGCDSGGGEEVPKELRAVASRAATAQLVAGEWARGAATTPYGSSTLGTITRHLEKDSSSLTALPMSASERDAALAHLSALSLAVREAAAAISQGNRPEVRVAMQRIGAEARVFSHGRPMP